MKNSEKAKEIAWNDSLYNDNQSCAEQCFIAALQMAQWKEEQMIQKAVEWLENNYSRYEQTYADVGGYVYSDFCMGKFINDFRKAMEENL